MKLASSSVRRGFTLIELLVVIAIIGILSSVVLASLNTARNKGADAATKSSLANARAQAELFYDTASNYTTVCTTGANNIQPMMTSAKNASGATTLSNDAAAAAATVVCNDVAGSWAAAAPMKATAGFWCVDSTGSSTIKTTAALALSAGTAVACGT